MPGGELTAAVALLLLLFTNKDLMWLVIVNVAAGLSQGIRWEEAGKSGGKRFKGMWFWVED